MAENENTEGEVTEPVEETAPEPAAPEAQAADTAETQAE